jgi:hypothetical protein
VTSALVGFAVLGGIAGAADVPAAPADGLRNIRVQVTTRRHETGYERGVEVSRPGGRGVGLQGRHSRTESRAGSVMDVLVMDGGRGSVRVAREVPHREWLWTWGVGRGLWSGVSWQEVETSLVVEPHLQPDGRIQVRVTPRFDYVIDARRLSTEVNELSTEVLVRPGEDVALGGRPGADEEFRTRFLVGIDERGRTVSLEMTLRASPE